MGVTTVQQAYGLDALTMRSPDRTRCVNAENPRGGKGKAAMSASHLGPSRKGTPCLRDIQPGQEVVLADLQGAGVIRHIWMTVAESTSPTGPNLLRNLILECYWDGEESPSVCAPLGDFFCCGHAQACRIESLPMAVYPRRGFNCYFPMPFHSGARIVLRNEHHEPVEAFFYQIDYAEKDDLPDDVMTFHAQWRRQRVTDLARDYVILDGVRGAGTYAGTYLALTALESRWWGEGEVKMYIDGDQDYPTWCSTGSEDYFGGAWSFAGHDPDGATVEQTYTGTFMGFPFRSRSLHDRESEYWDTDTPVTRGFYRWHIPDPIVFQESIKVTLQQIGVDEQGLFERQDDLASVAYWYQIEPHLSFPAEVLKTTERDRRPR
ncbi:glycoside hydrolase family 172 protein [Bifidobacterium indicum]|uniref:glycoside hydrolase family 172 protein n=2 Tax=Bifidobacterium indicum TaxID=1691 RepID=UPI0030DB92EC